MMLVIDLVNKIIGLFLLKEYIKVETKEERKFRSSLFGAN